MWMERSCGVYWMSIPEMLQLIALYSAVYMWHHISSLESHWTQGAPENSKFKVQNDIVSIFYLQNHSHVKSKNSPMKHSTLFLYMILDRGHYNVCNILKWHFANIDILVTKIELQSHTSI